MIRKLRIAILIGLAWFFLHCLWVVYDGMQPFKGKADVAVVLGTTVFIDGTVSPWLQGRIDEALCLYRNGQVKKIFVSGGYFTSGYAEGDAMQYYLLDRGVDSSDIIVDNYGDNTYLTARNLIAWNEKAQYSSAVAVSSFYHLTRTKYIFRKLGFKNISTSGSNAYFWADWHGLTREFLAFYYYLLKY